MWLYTHLPRGVADDMSADFSEQGHVGSKDPTVQKVADDCDLETGQAALVLAYGQRIHKGLGRMLVGAVTSVHYRRPRVTRKKIAGT